jgi:hypothetical protein
MTPSLPIGTKCSLTGVFPWRRDSIDRSLHHRLAVSDTLAPNATRRNLNGEIMGRLVGYLMALVVLAMLVAEFGPSAKQQWVSYSRQLAAARENAEAQAAKKEAVELEQAKKMDARAAANALDSAYLVRTYYENEIAADQGYKGCQIAVVGRVDTVGRNNENTPYVCLRGGEGVGDVQCFFSDDDATELARLQSGDTVTILGKCGGLRFNVLVGNCRILPTPPPIKPGPLIGTGKARDIVYVCDAAGGMLTKMQGLKNELQVDVNNLQPPQAFSVIFSVYRSDSAGPDALFNSTLVANSENKLKSQTFMSKEQAGGSDDLIPGLEMAFAMHPQMIYILTDGRFGNNAEVPTKIAELQARASPNVAINIIIYTDLMGLDGPVDTIVHKIAKDSGGQVRIVPPDWP